MNIAQCAGKRISILLKKFNMTKYRLTKITCLNPKTIDDLVAGKTSDVNLSTICLICNAFNITLDKFFSDSIFTPENIEI